MPSSMLQTPSYFANYTFHLYKPSPTKKLFIFPGYRHGVVAYNPCGFDLIAGFFAKGGVINDTDFECINNLEIEFTADSNDAKELSETLMGTV